MKNFKQLILAFGIFAITGSASAIPISGDIGFTGDYHTDTGSLGDATQIFIDNVTVSGSTTGSFAAENIKAGDAASYSGFTFNPTGPVTGLWSVGSFTFTLNTMSLDYQSDFAIILSGTGMTSSTDKDLDNNYGDWIFTANTSGSNFTFSSSSSVPEPAVILLLATGLLGFGFARKARKTT